MRRASPGSRWLLLLVFAAFLAAGGVAGAVAQSSGATLRLAFLPEWVLEQHRRMGGAVRPELRAALDRGVVDRVVFWWQPGIVQRRALVAKPVRVLAGAEALALGGRREFRLAALRRPAGATAWTEVEVAAESARAEDALVLEVGGELGTIRQVLGTVLIAGPDGGWVWLGLARRALVPSDGVPAAPFGRPLSRPDAARLFRGTGGVEFLVVRSPVETI